MSFQLRYSDPKGVERSPREAINQIPGIEGDSEGRTNVRRGGTKPEDQVRGPVNMSRSEVQPGLIATITTYTEPEVRNCTPPSLCLSGIDSRVPDKQLGCAKYKSNKPMVPYPDKTPRLNTEFLDTELRDPSDLA